MSDIRSKPYSKTGRNNWDEIFSGKPTVAPDPSLMKAFDDVGIVTSAPEAIRVLRTAKSSWQVQNLRLSAYEIVKDWVETDRMNFWREFNSNVPAGLEG